MKKGYSLPEDFSIKELTKITPISAYPNIRIWKGKKRKKDEAYKRYKQKKRQKSSKKHIIDIYV